MAEADGGDPPHARTPGCPGVPSGACGRLRERAILPLPYIPPCRAGPRGAAAPAGTGAPDPRDAASAAPPAESARAPRTRGDDGSSRTPAEACGTPRPLPGDEAASRGPDRRTDPATRTARGIDHIGDRYGTPCGARAHPRANNWY
ncbi:aggregation-promoting factor C-terminal-like domain-containing protein [Nocardiopsis flavescens]